MKRIYLAADIDGVRSVRVDVQPIAPRAMVVATDRLGDTSIDANDAGEDFNFNIAGVSLDAFQIAMFEHGFTVTRRRDDGWLLFEDIDEAAAADDDAALLSLIEMLIRISEKGKGDE